MSFPIHFPAFPRTPLSLVLLSFRESVRSIGWRRKENKSRGKIKERGRERIRRDKRNRAYQEKERKRFRWMGKLTRGLAPQYQDLTRCVSPPSRWDLQPPKPPPPPPLSEPLSSLLSSSSSSSKSRFLSPAPRRPLPIISASLPSQPPSLSCVATSAYNTTGNASC